LGGSRIQELRYNMVPQETTAADDEHRVDNFGGFLRCHATEEIRVIKAGVTVSASFPTLRTEQHGA